ncbi:unnamed protein product [Spirodela intermedia]|uniref:BSD domain-containing protein n=1 Tax=Spirodela intermedia TaxID=51605 RepID=A0A7I8IYS8_SPIIN|nr:unnamed protein product [Spirodela intermedia]CAA6663028.1 unnamed protein product [Spirodela intermedia]
MSWLAKSFANLIAKDEDEDGDDGGDRRRDGGEQTSGGESKVLPPAAAESDGGEGSGELNQGRGVKEDLSELSKTSPASYGPPSPSSASSPDGDSHRTDRDFGSNVPHPTLSPESANPDLVDDSPKIAGIRSDFAEIGGRFRSGISKLSNTKAVSEISKIASSFLQFGSDGEEEEMEDEQGLENKYGNSGIGAIGVTEEVLTFARNISMHPETWLDFPLFPDDETADDFDMSDPQQEHAFAVEQLVPRLAALRIELCPGHISEGCFWKIYFVLLHPRLSKHDAELLSTPQGSAATGLAESDEIFRRRLVRVVEEGRGPDGGGRILERSETVKHPVLSAEMRIVDKSVIEEDAAPIHRGKDIAAEVSPAPAEKYEDNGDEWPEDETTAVEIASARIASVPIADDEDVSFSDLEEDDDDSPPPPPPRAAGDPPATASKDGKPIALDAKESNEWSDLDDIDAI